MDTEKFIHYDTEDFILDNDFRTWVLHPDKKNDLIWSNYLEKYPEKKEQVKEAVLILKSLQPVEPEVPVQRINQILYELKPVSSTFRKISFNALKYAAVFILFISVGGLIYYSLSNQRQLPFTATSEESLQKGKLILADGTVREFETEQTAILQTSKGEITVNNDTVIRDVGSLKTTKTAMNQVIIPYGKRSEITLADGTHIWLNSGSQMSYPVVFTGDTREVYLSGEAFFDVETDLSRPFYVITKDIKLRVMGTRFNISSYDNDQITHAVLLSGKVSVGRNRIFANTMELSPGERIVYDKVDENITINKVNVNLYASWINGYLIFEREPLTEIFKKLERYYNKNIIMEGSFNDITFSGKLDLIEKIETVLANISFSSSFSVIMNNDCYTIKTIMPMKKN